jgi:hypothetical protein
MKSHVWAQYYAEMILQTIKSDEVLFCRKRLHGEQPTARDTDDCRRSRA